MDDGIREAIEAIAPRPIPEWWPMKGGARPNPDVRQQQGFTHAALEWPMARFTAI